MKTNKWVSLVLVALLNVGAFGNEPAAGGRPLRGESGSGSRDGGDHIRTLESLLPAAFGFIEVVNIWREIPFWMREYLDGVRLPNGDVPEVLRGTYYVERGRLSLDQEHIVQKRYALESNPQGRGRSVERARDGGVMEISLESTPCIHLYLEDSLARGRRCLQVAYPIMWMDDGRARHDTEYVSVGARYFWGRQVLTNTEFVERLNAVTEVISSQLDFGNRVSLEAAEKWSNVLAGVMPLVSDRRELIGVRSRAYEQFREELRSQREALSTAFDLAIEHSCRSDTLDALLHQLTLWNEESVCASIEEYSLTVSDPLRVMSLEMRSACRRIVQELGDDEGRGWVRLLMSCATQERAQELMKAVQVELD